MNFSSQAVITFTLLRCFGWLSHNDLATRNGGAGPQIPTPEGQSLGEHTFYLSLIPFKDDLLSAREQAEAFQTSLGDVGTGLHNGSLPSSASLLSVDSKAFAFTCVKTPEDGRGLIVRGVNLSHQSLSTHLDSLISLDSASKARIDETQTEMLKISEVNRISLEVNPYEISTLRLDFMRPIGDISDE